jgi:hypothetical protein
MGTSGAPRGPLRRRGFSALAWAGMSDVLPHDPDRCRPCRGTGRVISNLGGAAHEVTCPWCEGGGRFLPDHDAQAAPAESRR